MTTAAKTTAEVALGPTLVELIDDCRLSLHAAGRAAQPARSTPSP